MYDNTDKTNFEKLNKELNNKKVNICASFNHIIINEKDFSKKSIKKAYDDLKCFDFGAFSDLLYYEKWLEDMCGDKKR